MNTASDVAAGRIIGYRYHLLEKLGAGGMGVVYKAKDKLTGQAVALKQVLIASERLTFASRMDTDEDVHLALAQEFKTLASLRHQHIISVLDYGFDDARQPYFTMELLPNSQNLLEAARNQPLRLQIDLLIQVLQALSYLHRRGVLHRDLKPANVLVVDRQVKVLDFGLSASRDQATGLLGTVAYMAPELFGEAGASEASDLYAVGIMAYEILAGHHPFDSDSLSVLLNEILSVAPDVASLSISDSLQTILARLLDKQPEIRYKSANEVIAAFSAALDDPIPYETATTRESFLQAAQFVGREQELQTLNDALKQSLTGHGSVLLIGGESGVGKSRLLDELRIMALVEGAIVLRGQAISEGGTPYQLWRDIVRWMSIATPVEDSDASVLKVLVPDIAQLLDRPIPDASDLPPQLAQERLLKSIEALVKRQTSPLAIILEDLQWANESLQILSHLMATTRDRKLLIVGNYRDDEQPDLPKSLPGAQVVKLKRLTSGEISQLAEAMIGSVGKKAQIVNLLQRETEGNVFFVVEVVRALAEQSGQLDKITSTNLPEHIFTGGVQQIVHRRLARIHPEDQPLLQAAAVAGRVLELDIVQHIDPAMKLDRWLNDCAAVAVLEVQDGHWRFVHDKLREGLLLELHEDRRRELHRQVATATEASAADLNQLSQRAAVLAYHWGKAGDLTKEIRFAELAGDVANQLGTSKAAGGFYGQVLQALARLPGDQTTAQNTAQRQVDLILKQVQAVRMAEPPEVNLQRLAEAEKLAQTLPGPDGTPGTDKQRIGRIQILIGRIHYYNGAMPSAISHFQIALQIGLELQDEEMIALPGSTIARVLMLQGSYKRAVPLFVHSLRALEKNSTSVEVAITRGMYGLALTAIGQCQAGLTQIQAASEAVRAFNNQDAIATCYIYSAFHGLMIADPAWMIRDGLAAQQIAEQVGNWTQAYMGYALQGWGASRLGDHKTAHEKMDESKAIAQRAGGAAIIAEQFAAAEAEMAFNEGNYVEAVTLAEKAIVQAKAVGGIFAEGLARRYWAQALYANSTANFPEAEAQLKASLALYVAVDGFVEAARTRYVLGQMYRKQGQLETAREYLQQARAQAETSQLLNDLRLIQAEIALLPESLRSANGC